VRGGKTRDRSMASLPQRRFVIVEFDSPEAGGGNIGTVATPPHFWNMATTLGRAALNAEVTRQASGRGLCQMTSRLMMVRGGSWPLPLIFLLKARPRAAARRDGDPRVERVLII